jgi:hypothetical protein
MLSVTIPEAVKRMAGSSVIINCFCGLHFCVAVLLIEACDNYLVCALDTYQVQEVVDTFRCVISHFSSVAPSAHCVLGNGTIHCVAGFVAK